MALQAEQVGRLAEQLPAPAAPPAVPVHRRARPGRARPARRPPARRGRRPPGGRVTATGATRRCGSSSRSGSILVCCGSGGVGKTTTAAVLALEAARAGRRAVVVTIDPAKRLADALGLEGLTGTPSRIDGDWPGELWALMLDTKSTFDDLVAANAATPEQAPAHPRQPLLPQHLRRPVGHAGVHGDGEALRAARAHRLRPRRRRHPADPQRARLPRRAAAAVPLPRPPPVPHAHVAGPRAS